MAHAGHREEPARLRAHLLHAAGRLRHALVVVNSIERRKPGVAPAVVENQFAAEEIWKLYKKVKHLIHLP